jgi:hypothetical protein
VIAASHGAMLVILRQAGVKERVPMAA